MPDLIPSNATWTSANTAAAGGYDSQVCQTYFQSGMPDLLYFHLMPLGQVLTLQLLGDMTVRYARPTVLSSHATWTSANTAAAGGHDSQVCQTY